MEKDSEVPIILARPLLATRRPLTNVEEGKLTFRVNNEHVVFNIYRSFKSLNEVHMCHRIDNTYKNTSKHE